MKRVTKINIMFTGMLLIYIIMIFAVNLMPNDALSTNVLLVMPELLILVSAVIICLLVKSPSLKEVELGFVPVSTCLKSVVLAYLCLPLIGVVNAITSMINGNAVEGTLEIIETNPLWLNIVMIALIPACAEEFIFRGLIFGAYKKRNPFVGILLSAFLFGLLHLNVNQLSYAFVLGVVLGFMAYATGSIIPSIVMHFTINANSVVVAHLSNNLLKDMGNVGEQSAGSVTNSGSAGLMETLIAMLSVLLIVAVATSLAVLLFTNICKNNRGIKSVVAIVKKPMRNTYNDEGKFLDGYLITGMVVATGFIIYVDFVVRLLQ